MEELDHVGEGNDSQIALGNNLVTLSATATITDGDLDTDPVTYTLDLGGNVRFDDDVPLITATQSFVIANQSNLTATGTFDLDVGADDSGSFLSLSGNAPSGLYYYTFENNDGSATLVASTTVHPSGSTLATVLNNAYFRIDSDKDGTSEVTLLSERPTVSSGELLVSGLTSGHVITLAGGITLDGMQFGGAAGTVRTFIDEDELSGNGNGSEVINISSSAGDVGMGVGDNQVDSAEGMMLSKSNWGADTFTFGLERTNAGAASTVTVSFMAGVGATPDGTGLPVGAVEGQVTVQYTGKEHQMVTLDPSIDFDWIVIRVDNTQGNYRIDSLSYTSTVIPDNQLLSFDLTVTDGDGDTLTTPFEVEFAGGDSLTGTTLTGNGDSEVLVGTDKSDTIDGGALQDVVSYENADQGVVVNLAAGTATEGSVTDTLSNIEGVRGSAFDDILVGDGAANLIFGGAGDDRLTGGTGNDTLEGGLGKDTFAWGSTDADGGTDIIIDFTAGVGGDVLDLSDLLVGETEGTIDNYLKANFDNSTGNTTIEVYQGDANVSGATSIQTIVVNGDVSDLTSLISNGNLDVDN